MQAPFWHQGLNRYSYVFNDPVNNTDPSGFKSFNDVMSDGVGAFVGAGHIVAGAITAYGFGGGSSVLGGGSGMATGGYNISATVNNPRFGGKFAGSSSAASLYSNSATTRALEQRLGEAPDHRLAYGPESLPDPNSAFPNTYAGGVARERYFEWYQRAGNILLSAGSIYTAGSLLLARLGVGTAAGVPTLAAGTRRQMLGEALDVLKAAPGAERVGLLRQLIPQIQSRATGGAWSATEMAASGGARAWVGETYTLVIDASGQVFSGAHVAGAAQFGLVEGQMGVTSWSGLKLLF